MSSDAQIALEWAEYITSVRELHGDYAPQARAAARYILATAPPPQMSDMEWDDSVHAGLCAEHPLYGVVRMLEYDHMDKTVLCYTRQHHCEWSEGFDLTPLPGTRMDLTPRREQEPESTPEPEQHRQEDVKPDPQPGEAWMIEYEGKRYEAIHWYSPLYAHWAFVENREGLKTVESPEATPVSRLVPEQVPTHPTTLVTEDDYRGAPYGTVVWGNGPSSNMRSSLEKYGNAWLEAGDDGTFTPRHMAAAGPHQVLRWGDVS